jgi:glycolate oxidase FAD binding subunit
MSERTMSVDSVEALRTALGEDSIAADLHAYGLDGVVPRIVVAPRDELAMSRALAEADALGLSVVVRGGGQHMALGNMAESYDVTLSLERMPRTIDHEPADLTATVTAGTTLAALQAVLAEHGQHLPLDPPSDDARTTIGGIIAANAFGPTRHARGTVRDWLLGVRVLLADGTPTKAGGKVVKNVAGYEMTKLYAGSLGTLGVITEATFKVAPLPAAAVTIAAFFDSAEAATGTIMESSDAGLAFSAAEALSPTGANTVLGTARWAALFVASGGVRAVDRSLRDVQNIATACGGRVEVRDGADVWPAWRAGFAPHDVTLRASVAPSQVGSAMAMLDRRLAGASLALSATVTAGVIRCVLRPSSEQAAAAAIDVARSVVQRHGGTMIVECAPPAAKHTIDVFGDTRNDFAIMRRIKEEFDPRRTLAPGRFAGRL